MSISIQDVEHLAQLARLSLSADEKERYASQLSDILSYFEKLQTLDTSGIEPLSSVLPIDTVMREDVASSSLDNQALLRNVEQTDKEDGMFRVDTVIERD